MFEFDPERSLRKPGRRSFLFMFGAALVAPIPAEAKPEVIDSPYNDYENIWTQMAGENLRSGDWVSLRSGLLYRVNATGPSEPMFMVSRDWLKGDDIYIRVRESFSGVLVYDSDV